jgi:hypothetical protein
MNDVRKKSKELDHYLKEKISEAIIQLRELGKPSNKSGTDILYYTGNWAKDIYDNYTEKQAEKIFKNVEKLKKGLLLYQVKLSSFKDNEGEIWSGYDYYAKKI